MPISLNSWIPSHTPTLTTLKSIAATHASGLSSTLTSALAKVSTVTVPADFYEISQVIRGAQASLTIISAEEVLVTATESAVKAGATRAIFEATSNLKELADERNLYDTTLNRPANIVYLVVFFLQFLYFLALMWKSRYHWFNITFACGYGLEFAGFLGRVLSFMHNTQRTYYLLQFVSLTIAPAFIMAGVYFLFAQCVVIYGRRYSILKPMWYSYFFIGCDVISLIIQAIGGAMASSASSTHLDPSNGKNIMTAGIVFQVFAMSIFLGFWLLFLKRCFFKVVDDEELPPDFTSHSMAKPTPINFVKMLCNVQSAREYSSKYREPVYNSKYAGIRQRAPFQLLPLGITISVIVVYIRCIYRVVELIQGFSGYLMVHEIYLMFLDALMIALCGFIFFPLHPIWAIGSENTIKRSVITHNQDEISGNEKEQEQSDTFSGSL